MSSSPERPRTPPLAETRAALLRAAGEVFAEVGFHGATVRDICRRAGANVAAVNYHFGDKEPLYVEVLRHAMARAQARHPFDGGTAPTAPPEERLRGFVRNFLGRLFEPGEHAWLGRLMAQEMIAPSHALDLMVTERIRPMADQLREIIQRIVGPGCSEAELRLCGFSVVSQCLFYNHCRSVVSRLFPDQALTPDAVEELAAHITRFSLAGLKDRARADRRRGVRAARRPAPKA
jgi:AcrR family transcriptional regulator